MSVAITSLRGLSDSVAASGAPIRFSAPGYGVTHAQTSPFFYVAIAHVEADAAMASHLADRLADVCHAVTVRVDAPRPIALGASVAVVCVWSAAAEAAGAASAMAAHVRGGRFGLLARLDRAPAPSALAGLVAVGGGPTDRVVFAGLVRDALAWARDAADEDVAQVYVAASEEHARGGFAAGLAAGMALLSVAGIGGYVLLPHYAVDSAASLTPTATSDVTLAEAAAVAPTVDVAYAPGAMEAATPLADAAFADGLVSARFGADLKVTFAAPAPRAAAPIPAPVIVADAEVRLVPVDSAPDGPPGAGAQIAAIDGPAPASDGIVGAPLYAAELRGSTAAFINDMVIDVPFDQ
jgi:hypothetical protein